MPIAGYRSWVGFAKPNGISYLTGAVSAAGTSLTVATTGNGIIAVPASSTVYIVDGVNSEQVAVSAGGGTGTLTVAALAHNHPANTPIFSQLTASLGPANWTPVTNVDYQDVIGFIEDKGVRGSNVAVYNVTQGNAWSELQLDGDVFPDMFGYLLGSIYGAVDFSGGTPNSHTFAGSNIISTYGYGQPTPLLVFIYNGNNVRVFAGAKAHEVQIKYDPVKNLEYMSKWMALESGVVTSYTATFTTVTPQGAWQASTSINSTTVNNVLAADFTIKRDTIDAIVTLDGSQQATVIWAGPLSTTGNMNLTYEDDTNMNIYLNGTPVPVTFDLNQGTGGTAVEVKLQMTKCLFTNGWKPKIVGGKGYVEIGGPVSAVGNTTDANTAGGGYSPSRAVLKNTIATGTYQ